MSSFEDTTAVPGAMPAGWTIEKMPEGITLRDWFAGMALQGIMAGGWEVEYSCLAYELADAMMEERDK